MSEYNVVLLDQGGFEIVSDPIEGMGNAKQRARYLLSEDFAASVESAHEVLGTAKVEVRNAAGICLWDAFPKRSQPLPPSEEELDDVSPSLRC